MRSVKKLLLFISLSFFLSGCATVSVHRFHTEKAFAPTKPADISVIMAKPAGTDLIELGEINISGASSWPQAERIFRARAAGLGADAVYVASQQQRTRQYVYPADCYVRQDYWYPYRRHGWHHYYYPDYPGAYYYCYGYRTETEIFIYATGIAIKYTKPKS